MEATMEALAREFPPLLKGQGCRPVCEYVSSRGFLCALALTLLTILARPVPARRRHGQDHDHSVKADRSHSTPIMQTAPQLYLNKILGKN